MLLANIGLVFTIIAWGSTTPVLNELLKSWDPVAMTAARFILTSAVFYGWVRMAEGRFSVLDAASRKHVIILGSIMAVFSLLMTYAVQFSNPINISIIAAASPIAAGVVDRFLTGRNPPKAIIAAIPLAIFGAVLTGVDLRALFKGDITFRFEGGEILMLIGVFLWSSYSALLQRWLTGMSQLQRTALTFIGATPILVIASIVLLVFGLEHVPQAWPDGKEWSLLLWTSLATSIFGTYFWNVGVRHIGIVVATIFLNLIPAVSILVSMLFGLEPRIEQLLGGLLVILAVGQTQIRHFWRKK